MAEPDDIFAPRKPEETVRFYRYRSQLPKGPIADTPVARLVYMELFREWALNMLAVMRARPPKKP